MEEKLWFKRKRYGWGWYPVSWEGWTVTLVYIALILSLAFTIDESSPDSEIAFMLILPITLLTVTLIRICYAKGEKPRWQWNDKPLKNTQNEDTT